MPHLARSSATVRLRRRRDVPDLTPESERTASTAPRRPVHPNAARSPAWTRALSPQPRVPGRLRRRGAPTRPIEVAPLWHRASLAQRLRTAHAAPCRIRQSEAGSTSRRKRRRQVAPRPPVVALGDPEAIRHAKHVAIDGQAGTPRAWPSTTLAVFRPTPGSARALHVGRDLRPRAARPLLRHADNGARLHSEESSGLDLRLEFLRRWRARGRARRGNARRAPA